jgi:hypothetical protein
VVLQWNETNDHWEIESGGTTGRILTTGDEGSGNGLDVDLLDGEQGSYYLNYNNFTNTPSNLSDFSNDENYIKLTDLSASGDLNYNSSTGVFSVTTYKSSDFDTDFSGKSTSDLSEGTNLYYTDTRARNALSVSGDLSYSSTTGVVSFTERTDAEVRGLFSASGDLSYNSSTGEFSVTVPAGYDSSDFNTDFNSKTTDDLSEGSNNLYYTDARVDSRIGNGTLTINAGNSLTGGGAFSANQSSNSTVTIDHADTSSQGSVNNSGNTFIQDITVDGFGHITGINSESVSGFVQENTAVTFTTVTADDFNSTSDARKKTNVETLTDPLTKVSNLRGVSFDWIENDESSIGLIAQELEEVIPEVVSTGDDGLKSVSYGNLVGLLIEAIKDQQNQIDELKNKVYK